MDLVAPALPLSLALIVGLFGSTLALQARNNRYQTTIMHKLTAETPLDDFVHSAIPASLSKRARALSDPVVIVAPLAVLVLAVLGFDELDHGRLLAGGLAFLLEFGCLVLYKQIVCVSTRLPPATQTHMERSCCGVTTSSWTDYGISGHTGLCILLFLKLRSVPSLAIALIQGAVVLINRDHYTLDVLHSWVFSFSVVGCFNELSVAASCAIVEIFALQSGYLDKLCL